MKGMARAVAIPDGNNLPALAYWVAVLMIFYLVIPVLIVKFGFRRRLTDFGLRPKIETGFVKLLLACTAMMLPLVYLMSLTSGFAAKYPFFKVADGMPYFSSAFVIWELIYFVQFFGLEFFFRGFLVHSLKPSLGAYSIFVMTDPVLNDPFRQAARRNLRRRSSPAYFSAGSATATARSGLALLLHCTVAFSMDILALE